MRIVETVFGFSSGWSSKATYCQTCFGCPACACSCAHLHGTYRGRGIRFVPPVFNVAWAGKIQLVEGSKMPGLFSGLWVRGVAAAKAALLTAGTLGAQEWGAELLMGEGKVEPNSWWGAELLSPGTRDLDVTRRRLWSLAFGSQFLGPGGSWAVPIPSVELQGLPGMGEIVWIWRQGGPVRTPLFFCFFFLSFSSSLGISFTYMYCRLFSDKDPARSLWCRSLLTWWCCPHPLPLALQMFFSSVLLWLLNCPSF